MQHRLKRMGCAKQQLPPQLLCLLHPAPAAARLSPRMMPHTY
jgi:hypothetical protein